MSEIVDEFKEQSKNFFHGFIRILPFFLAFIIILEALSLTAFSKAQTSDYKNELSKAYSFMLEKENSIQVVTIGNSDLYSAFVPATLWDEYGYTSSVISSPHQSPLQSFDMMETFYEGQSPEVVIIETDMLYDSAPKGGSAVMAANPLNTLFDYLNPDDFEQLFRNQFSVFTYHDRWKQYGKKAGKPETPNSHGYKYSGRINEVIIDDYMEPTDEYEMITKVNEDNTKRLVKFCRDRGAQVFFVEMPSITSWNSYRHNAVADFAKSINVDFLDLNLLTKDMGLNLEQSFRDVGNHLNYNGAVVTTQYLGKYIAENYNLENRHHNPDYKYWQKTINAFYKEIKKENKKELKQKGNYIELA
ncbi:MAG: hypothetical protein IJS03_00035 [Eubacterium sp.]|nr:hypothetical protein [Eubacterium sp.]